MGRIRIRSAWRLTLKARLMMNMRRDISKFRRAGKHISAFLLSWQLENMLAAVDTHFDVHIWPVSASELEKQNLEGFSFPLTATFDYSAFADYGNPPI